MLSSIGERASVVEKRCDRATNRTVGGARDADLAIAWRRTRRHAVSGTDRGADAQHSRRRTSLLYLSATRIDFYYDRFLLEADGNVRVQTSDGFTVTGDAFSMDLKLNRFLVAGHVTLHDASGTVSGAAISDFLDFQRIYFVPVTTEPDRWTFLNGDLAHPVKGRVMPGDAFYFPIIGQHPSITASERDRRIRRRTCASSAPERKSGGPACHWGAYVVNFSSNQYFAQNTLSGASVDLTWTLAGNTELAYRASTCATTRRIRHICRSSSTSSATHEYAIFSVNPATRAEKWWNLPCFTKSSAAAFKSKPLPSFTRSRIGSASRRGAADDVYQRDVCLAALLRCRRRRS